jgi:C-terminal processing protease CtpA/Prc
VGGVNSSKGNSPVYVRNIATSGLAAEDGRLQSGDEIVKINGISLSKMPQEDVVKIIKKTVGDVTLTINPREVML